MRLPIKVSSRVLLMPRQNAIRQRKQCRRALLMMRATATLRAMPRFLRACRQCYRMPAMRPDKRLGWLKIIAGKIAE